MKKVVIELDDFHDDILTITAIGRNHTYQGLTNATIVATAGFDLKNGTNIRIDKDGKWYQRKDGE